MTESTPVAYILEIHTCFVAPQRTLTTRRTVVIDCPLCFRRHTHGWPIGDSLPLNRVKHCVTGSELPGPESYDIELLPGAAL